MTEVVRPLVVMDNLELGPKFKKMTRIVSGRILSSTRVGSRYIFSCELVWSWNFVLSHELGPVILIL